MKPRKKEIIIFQAGRPKLFRSAPLGEINYVGAGAERKKYTFSLLCSNKPSCREHAYNVCTLLLPFPVFTAVIFITAARSEGRDEKETEIIIAFARNNFLVFFFVPSLPCCLFLKCQGEEETKPLFSCKVEHTSSVA